MNRTTQTFDQHSVELIQHQSENWLAAQDIAACLEYQKGARSVLTIYERNREELDEYSTCLKLRTVDGKQRQVRIFNERGVMLITMFSKQPKAKAFRRWAIEVLSQYRQGTLELTPRQPVQPAPAPQQVTIDQDEYIDLLKVKITQLEANQSKKHKFITPSDVQKMLALKSQGLGCSRIARQVGCSKDTVLRHLRKAGGAA